MHRACFINLSSCSVLVLMAAFACHLQGSAFKQCYTVHFHACVGLLI